MTLNEPKECWLPNRLLMLAYTVGVVGMILTSVFKGVDTVLKPQTLMLCFVFALLGGLALFKGISILKCPSKVILGGALFVAVTALVDSTLI